MTKTYLTAFSILVCTLICNIVVKAQKNVCGFKPDQKTLNISKKFTADYYNNKVSNAAIVGYRIPVVFHVIDNSSTTTLITDTQIQTVLTNLNHAFAGTGPWTGRLNTNIQFEMAAHNEACSPTNAIVRYDASGVANYVAGGVTNEGFSWSQLQESSLPVKGQAGLIAKPVWNKNFYMNIWMVTNLDPGVGGLGGPSDGLILYTADVNNFPTSGLVPHEVGHYLSLLHPFLDDTDGSCGCGDGDGIADTASMINYGIGSTCPHESGCDQVTRDKINPCTNQPFGNLQFNFMNYLDVECSLTFSPDQAAVMQNFIANYHNGLQYSPGLGNTNPQAIIVGPEQYCIDSNKEIPLRALCPCGTIQSLTLNDQSITEADLQSYPLLPPGESTIFNYSLTCSGGSTASTAIIFYALGVRQISTTCTANNTYRVSFSNPSNYIVMPSIGTLVNNNMVENIPLGADCILTISDGQGCETTQTILAPCCSLGGACSPMATAGLSPFFGVAEVNFNTLNHSSGSAAEDGANYINLNCSNTTTVDPGSSYALKVIGYFINQHYVKVWIDWNNNGEFTNTELVLSGQTPGGEAENSVTANIMIPSTAMRGVSLRMRVLADLSNLSTACNIYGDEPPAQARIAGPAGAGQIIDYGVSVSGTALPLKLLSFDAKENTKGNLLQWKTSNAVNVSHFEIEKSTDGKDFGRIGQITFSNEKNNYEFLDNENSNLAYYRLKIVDQDLTYDYSKVVAIEGILNNVFRVLKNPSTADQIVIETSLNKPTIQIIDALGKIIDFEVTQSDKYEYIIKIKQTFPSQIIFINLTGPNGVQKTKRVFIE